MSIYEKHLISDPRLPFIFHSYTRSKRGIIAGVGNWHENIELLYFTRGSATVTSNEHHIEAHAGDIAIINANCIHDIFAHEETHFYCLIADRAFCLANHFDTNYINFSSLINDVEIAALIEEFATEYKNENTPYRIQNLRAILLKIMTLLCRNHSIEIKLPHTDTHLFSAIKLALGYIYSLSHTPLSLDSIADAAGLSKYYLAREFHKITGYTVTAYINRIRCDKAANLLAEKNLSIESIARTCGFSNISYFTRTFKKIVGILPSEYRTKYTKRG